MACGYCGEDGHNVTTCPKKTHDELNDVLADIEDLEMARAKIDAAIERARKREKQLKEKQQKNEKKDPKKKGDSGLYGVD